MNAVELHRYAHIHCSWSAIFWKLKVSLFSLEVHVNTGLANASATPREARESKILFIHLYYIYLFWVILPWCSQCNARWHTHHQEALSGCPSLLSNSLSLLFRISCGRWSFSLSLNTSVTELHDKQNTWQYYQQTIHVQVYGQTILAIRSLRKSGILEWMPTPTLQPSNAIWIGILDTTKVGCICC